MEINSYLCIRKEIYFFIKKGTYILCLKAFAAIVLISHIKAKNKPYFALKSTLPYSCQHNMLGWLKKHLNGLKSNVIAAYSNSIKKANKHFCLLAFIINVPQLIRFIIIKPSLDYVFPGIKFKSG